MGVQQLLQSHKTLVQQLLHQQHLQEKAIRLMVGSQIQNLQQPMRLLQFRHKTSHFMQNGQLTNTRLHLIQMVDPL
jgi:hypothetical protein